VVHHRHAQPAPYLVLAHPAGEPFELFPATPSVVVAVAVAVGHGRVQDGNHHRQRRDLDQRPRPLGSELDPADAVVEGVAHRHEVPPLWPVRPQRFAPVALLGAEVPLARLAVHVVLAGHDDHPVAGQRHQGGQLDQERQRPVKLVRHALLGQVARHHHQVRPQPLAVGQPGQVVPQRRIPGTVPGV
jgi:hypothetical protein